MYVNENYYGESAKVLTKAMLDEWYTKYTDSPNANTYTQETFQKIYKEPYIKYQNMIENYSIYLLPNAYTDYFSYGITSRLRKLTYSSYQEAFGVRLVVTLSSDVRITKKTTKTVTSRNMDAYGGDQTYNVWNIK